VCLVCLPHDALFVAASAKRAVFLEDLVLGSCSCSCSESEGLMLVRWQLRPCRSTAITVSGSSRSDQSSSLRSSRATFPAKPWSLTLTNTALTLTPCQYSGSSRFDQHIHDLMLNRSLRRWRRRAIANNAAHRTSRSF
jgi:hypothetical protein